MGCEMKNISFLSFYFSCGFEPNVAVEQRWEFLISIRFCILSKSSSLNLNRIDEFVFCMYFHFTLLLPIFTCLISKMKTHLFIIVQFYFMKKLKAVVAPCSLREDWWSVCIVESLLQHRSLTGTTNRSFLWLA